MIDHSKVAFDVDGVVADTISLFLEIGRTDYGITHVNYEDISSYSVDSLDHVDPDIVTEIFTRIMEGDVALPLRPITGAPEVLNKLLDKNGSLLFVTARPKKETILAWMEGLFPGNEENIEIIPTGSFEAKTNILLDRKIRYFVEDRLETCYLLADAGITPILYNQPWNRGKHPFPNVDNWQELENMLGLS